MPGVSPEWQADLTCNGPQAVPRPIEPMNLEALVARLERGTNVVSCVEKGQPVHRTHAQIFTDVRAACARLARWGVERGMRVGIRAPNGYQWIVHDLALMELRAVSVAFTEDFASLGAQELCEKYSLSLMLVAREEWAALAHPPPFIACLEDCPDDRRALPRAAGPQDPEFARPWLAFSSGSSGGVKGIEMSRPGLERNLDALVAAVGVRADDRLLLFLPMSNFQQRTMYYSALWYGFDLIISDPSRLFHALTQFRPTLLVAPPALYEMLENQLHNLPPWKRRFVSAALAVLGARPLRRVLAPVLFREVHQRFGGSMRLMITGMAPIKPRTLRLFARMGLPLFEMYGMVEAGAIAVNVPQACRPGSVGRVLPGTRLDFTAEGEIVITRPQIAALRYFECADGESERTFVAPGSLATGDIGYLDEDGYLFLTGRKKEVIVMSDGRKVHPESVEAEIDKCPDVAKSVVFGGAGAPFLVTVVLPKRPLDAKARQRIEKFVADASAGHSRFVIGRVVFTDVPFTRENGFLRPNLKLDRRHIASHFRDEVRVLEV